MKRLYNDPDDQQTTLLEWRSVSEKTNPQQYRYVQDELAKPKFLQETKPLASSIGTATHTVLQMIPLGMKPTQDTLALLIAREKSNFSEEIAKKLTDRVFYGFIKLN